MNPKICPYPGLRPFNVEESIFFKGRDLHIRQIIKKLEEKKILILTGASGDGKSSLVYAGVIPNARAGFFRAKHNNWLFAAFRPERNPLKNLAQCIASNLQIDQNSCEQELNYGFSALVDLYKKSPFYIDENSESWKNLTDSEKKQRKLKGANLFILADQFEEFFTNTENFNQGKPTNNSYTTVNLLLETARIALRDNLPIYVICTMRSDFISQSVAFRGLPETIGFSQFFVPRLNRNELQQVIEEPAILSGGRVTKRLKELLINELHDGFDQLPLLQHTLKQLWENAQNGEEEIDILHLAKLGGINQKLLPSEDKEKFAEWISKTGNQRKKYFENPSASNVLNAHANYLYDAAYGYFMENTDWAGKTLTREDSELIIKTAFQSLVKIDDGRAVRNRMSLRDITGIIDQPHIKYESVCGVLNIFRLKDNTFLYPFITNEDIESKYLNSNTVLDITHESLIRNWEYLKKWNEEEFENYTNFNDFNIQLQRWINNGMSNDFLLSIGPLSYFEDWYQKCKPNRYWLAKYDTSTLDYTVKLDRAEVISQNTEEFLILSRENIARIEKAKRRRKNILLSAATIVILTLSGFTYWAMSEKKHAQEQKLVAEQQTDTAKYQQKKAIIANNKAEQQKLIAEKKAHEAILAKLQSDSARSYAESMRLLADEKTQLANREAENAKREKQIAEEQRHIAELQTKIAISAGDSAKMLSFLAISQSLCFKATQKFDDKQLNLLLALQAYNFNQKYGGYFRDALLFNALRYSLMNLEPKNNINFTQNSISAFQFSDNRISAVCKNGDIINYDISSKKIINQTNPIQSKIPINNSYFLSANLIIVNYEDKKTILVNSETGKTIELSGNKDFIRAAALSSAKDFVVTGSRDKKIRFWKTETGENFQTFVTKDRITSLILTADEKSIYAGLSNGELYKINCETKKQELIENNKTAIYVMREFPDQSRIAVGYANGEMKLFDTNDNKKFINLTVSNSGVRFITIDSNSQLLATCSDDKVIKIYDLKNIERNPEYITEINQKILNLKFNGTKLAAITTDNDLYILETNPENYANQIRKILVRNFTPDEWGTYIGERIRYEKTK
jgi:hypothetical protein